MENNANNIESIQNADWDVIVIGTGMGGGTIGYSLAKAGKKVLFLEKGRNHSTKNDALMGNYAESFFPEPAAPDLKHADLLARAGRWSEELVDVSSPKKLTHIPFLGTGTGGSSALYGMVMERFFPSDFSPREHFPSLPKHIDLPEKWPFTYDELAPYYCQAEKLYRVRGEHDSLRGKEPNGYFSSPPPLSEVSKELFNFFRNKNFHPYHLPTACEYLSGCACCQGYLCDKDCKNDSARICVGPAVSEYGACLLEQCEALRLQTDSTKVTGVDCLYDGERIAFQAPLVVLAAGPLDSPRLLLNSASKHWPNGVANKSGLVGRFFMRHYVDLYALKTKTNVKESSSFKEIAFNDYYLHEGDKLGTIQSFGSLPAAPVLVAGMEKDIREKVSPIAAAFFKIAKPIVEIYLGRTLSRRTILATVMEDLPSSQNYVALGDRTDSFGRRNLMMNYTVSEYEQARIRAFRQEMKSVLSPYSYMFIKQAENNERMAHACGTCRSGNNPQNSVLDKYNKAHDLENLFVVDSSFFPSSAGTNPALTVAANALRVSDYLLRQN